MVVGDERLYNSRIPTDAASVWRQECVNTGSIFNEAQTLAVISHTSSKQGEEKCSVLSKCARSLTARSLAPVGRVAHYHLDPRTR